MSTSMRRPVCRVTCLCLLKSAPSSCANIRSGFEENLWLLELLIPVLKSGLDFEAFLLAFLILSLSGWFFQSRELAQLLLQNFLAFSILRYFLSNGLLHFGQSIVSTICLPYFLELAILTFSRRFCIPSFVNASFLCFHLT